MKIVRHLDHSLRPEDFLPSVKTEILRLGRAVDDGIGEILDFKDWMRLSGLSLAFSTESHRHMLDFKCSGIRRARSNERPTNRNAEGEHQDHFVFAEDGSKIDISLSATTKSDTLSNRGEGSRSQTDLPPLRDTLRYHREEGGLDRGHIESYWRQLEGWHPTPGSVASLMKKDILSVLSDEIGTRYASYDEYDWMESNPRVGSESDSP